MAMCLLLIQFTGDVRCIELLVGFGAFLCLFCLHHSHLYHFNHYVLASCFKVLLFSLPVTGSNQSPKVVPIPTASHLLSCP